jgi:hypothetical protein
LFVTQPANGVFNFYIIYTLASQVAREAKGESQGVKKSVGGVKKIIKFGLSKLHLSLKNSNGEHIL